MAKKQKRPSALRMNNAPERVIKPKRQQQKKKTKPTRNTPSTPATPAVASASSFSQQDRKKPFKKAGSNKFKSRKKYKRR